MKAPDKASRGKLAGGLDALKQLREKLPAAPVAAAPSARRDDQAFMPDAFPAPVAATAPDSPKEDARRGGRVRLRAAPRKPSDLPKPRYDIHNTKIPTHSPVADIGGTASLTRADKALFRRAVSEVSPIKDTLRAVLEHVPDESPEILRQRRERAMGREMVTLVPVSDDYHPPETAGDDACYVRSRHGPDLLKGLQRGKWPIGASLDLHGDTLEQARERFDRFLKSCLDHQIRCVRIVHGKGYGSRDGEPVLKQLVRRWLRQLDVVQAYSECAEPEGGAGAVQVLLRLDGPPRGHSGVKA